MFLESKAVKWSSVGIKHLQSRFAEKMYSSQMKSGQIKKTGGGSDVNVVERWGQSSKAQELTQCTVVFLLSTIERVKVLQQKNLCDFLLNFYT